MISRSGGSSEFAGVNSHVVVGEEDSRDCHSGQTYVGVSYPGGADAGGVCRGWRATCLQVSHMEMVRNRKKRLEVYTQV